MGTEEKVTTAMAGPASGGGFSASNRGRRPGVGTLYLLSRLVGRLGVPWFILRG
jgi:hypothetical protein